MSTTPVRDVGAFTDAAKIIVNNGLGDAIYPTAQLDVVSSTTLTNITGMSTQLTSGVYSINSKFAGTAGASGGWKIGFNYSNGLTLNSIDVTGFAFTASSTVFPNRVSSTTAGTAIISSTSAVTSGSIYGIINVATAGQLDIQFAQNASNSTSSTIYGGSIAYIRKIA